jgi:hypothetical protein
VTKHEHKAECKNARDVHAQRNQEHKEKAVIAAPNTVVDPRAVVIKRLQKYITGLSVRTITHINNYSFIRLISSFSFSS